LALRAETPKQSIASHLDEISTGVLSPSAEALFADHIVGGRILLPGVGYLEMMFIANLGRHSAFTDVAFIRPCWLPQPGTNKRCVLRCTSQGEGMFEIASWRGVASTVKSKLTTHFRAVIDNGDTASGVMQMKVSRAASFVRRTQKPSVDEEAAAQAENHAVFEQELVPSWTGSLNAMPPAGREERVPLLYTRGRGVNERTTKVLPCASPTDLNSSNEESYPISSLEPAVLDSLRFLGMSLMPRPLLAVHGIDYDDSFDMRACSILRDCGLGAWRGARAGLPNAQCFNTKDCHLPLMPSSRTKTAKDVRIHEVSKYSESKNKAVKASAPARPRADIADVVRKTVKMLLGTEVPDDAPLMGAGLDSIAAVELV
jgi:hypothetical protein